MGKKHKKFKQQQPPQHAARPTIAKQQHHHHHHQQKQPPAQQPSAQSGKPSSSGKLPYQASHSTLLLGEGDLSFAAALVLRWGDATNLTATAFDDEESARAKYADLGDNLETVESLGGKVFFGVDASKCHAHKAVGRHGPFDRVIFNFPHVGSGIKDQARNVHSNQTLLRGTFQSALALVAPRGELHLTLKRGMPYDAWQPVTIAKMCGWRVAHCTPFRPELFPGYAHRRSIGDEHAGSAAQHEPNSEITGARTYAFVNAEEAHTQPGGGGDGGGSGGSNNKMRHHGGGGSARGGAAGGGGGGGGHSQGGKMKKKARLGGGRGKR
jgi:25S rRNA (uracil2634-N3)-methyltransferase